MQQVLICGLKMQNKLLALTLLTALVGCSEYGSMNECELAESQKYDRPINTTEYYMIQGYCDKFKN